MVSVVMAPTLEKELLEAISDQNKDNHNPPDFT
jgi:hypothetical protein